MWQKTSSKWLIISSKKKNSTIYLQVCFGMLKCGLSVQIFFGWLYIIQGNTHILYSSIEASQHQFYTLSHILCVFVQVYQHWRVNGRNISRPKQRATTTYHRPRTVRWSSHTQIKYYWYITWQIITNFFDTLRYSQSVSRLGRVLNLIFCSKFLVMKCVRSPSWLTVPSNSRALDIVALRPSTCPPLAPTPRAPPPHAPLISSRLLLSCMPRTTRSGTDRTRTSAITWAGHGESSRSGSRGGVAWSGGGAGTRGGASSGEMELFGWTSSEESGLAHSSGSERVGGCSVESVPTGCNLCRSVYLLKSSR